MATKTYYNEAAVYALKFVNQTNRHVFLTGKAGTGKTTFLKNLKDNSYKNTIVAAPTGIAAINAGGVTLHSLFHLPFGAFLPENQSFGNEEITTQLTTPKKLLASFQMNKTKRRMLQEMELLIIDEVSMLRADLLDAIDTILRFIRRNKSTPFGGVQILFIGDLLQLPPVVKDDEWHYLSKFYPSIFFFHALALRQNPAIYVELDKIYRQEDKVFISLLNNLRNDCMTTADHQLLNKYYKPGFEPKNNEGYIYLTTHNRTADEINQQALKRLKEKTFTYTAEVEGDFPDYLFPIEYELNLKKNAQVMFIKNDYSGEGRYFNGKIGTISELNDEYIEVEFHDGSPSTSVEPYTWENKKYSLNSETNEIEEKIVGQFVHYPIKLAWSITVHKSQGLTFDKAIIDVSKAFAPGQIYVALSRLTSLNGLVLTGKIPSYGLRPNQDLINFTEHAPSGYQLEEVLKTESQRYIALTALNAFNFVHITTGLTYHLESYNKDVTKSAKQKYKEWAASIQSDFQPVYNVARKFQAQLTKIIDKYQTGLLLVLQKRLKSAKAYFEPLFDQYTERIISQIKIVESEKGVKKYITELKELESLFFSQLQKIYKAEAIVKAAITQSELSKETISNNHLSLKHSYQIKEIRGNTTEKQKRKGPNEKKDKGPGTKEKTFNLYKEGKTIKEIAKERQLAESTIEGHIAHYVGQGLVDAIDFIDSKKLKIINDAIEELGTLQLGQIKSFLGNNFTYSEIRFGAADYLYKQLKNND